MAAEQPKPGAGAEALRKKLGHVYWIGGGSGGGKSTVAGALAARYGLRPYSTDAVMSEHAGRTTSEKSPFLGAFAAMDMDERWVNRSPEVMLDTFHWFRGEGFDSIIEDLVALADGPGVVVEGFRLLPRMVQPYLTVPEHAVWLLPTSQFRRAAFASRGTLWEIPNRTSDPGRALHNLLERDRMFTERLRREIDDLGLHAIDIDTGTSEEELITHVADMFGLRT